MITQGEYNLYAERMDEYVAKIGVLHKWWKILKWWLIREAYCPRCEKVVKWRYGKGKGYERIMCDCGLGFVWKDGELYDIFILDY